MHLKPERIGHGIRSAEDPNLLNALRGAGVAIDISLTSNCRTGVWPNLETHPIKKIHAAGICISLNTDDPALFYTTLHEEYAHGARLLELDKVGIQRLVLGALHSSFLSSQEKRALEQRMSSEFALLETP